MKPERVETALTLSPQFYDAALDPSKWPAVLRDLRKVLNVEIAQVNIANVINGTVLVTVDDGMTDEQKRAYLTYKDFVHADPRTPVVMRTPYRPFHCQQFISEADWHASAAYQYLHKPWGFEYTMMYVVPLENTAIVSLLGLTRHRDTGAFTQDDLDHLSLYVPHLRRAFEVMMALSSARERTEAFAGVFDRLEEAVIIVDRFSRVQYANGSARALIDRRRALTMADGSVRAADPRVSRDLRDAILDAGVAAMSGRPLPRRDIVLPVGDDGLPLRATVSPLSGDAGASTGLSIDGGLVGLFITDPSRRYETDPECLQRLFGLTTTEAVLAAGLAIHGSAARLAEAEGRNYETVRGHLKAIREKLGVSSQGEVIRLVTQAMR